MCSVVQYVVVVQCIIAEANTTAYFMDPGSSLSNIQVSSPKCELDL